MTQYAQVRFEHLRRLCRNQAIRNFLQRAQCFCSKQPLYFGQKAYVRVDVTLRGTLQKNNRI
jgi:hypothetical protein